MKKILLLDTSFAAVPIYEYLIRGGNQVWVMGNRSQDALAIRAGEFWIEQDYSRVEEVKRHIESRKIEYVVPGCTDTSIEVCLQLGINEDLYDDVETYRKLGNKKEFRKICSELDLPAPRVVGIDDFPLEGRYICKPTDAFSGRGVTVVEGDNPKEVRRAYDTARNESLSSQAIIETYVSGQLYSYSAFLVGKKVTEYFVVKEGSSVNPYAVDTSYVDEKMDGRVLNVLKKSLERLSEELGLKDGLLHLQFIVEDDKPYMIELSRRAPGDLYSLLVQYTTGFDYAAKYASFFIREDCRTSRKDRKYIIRHTVASRETCDFLSLKFKYPIRIYSYFPLLGLGNRVEANQKTRVGIVFSASDSIDALMREYGNYMAREIYTIDKL